MVLVEREIFGRKMSFETGRIAKQANGAVVVRSGDTVVLVTACMGAERESDFLPLSIDYVEKTYATGKIPGGFFKREGRQSEHETLTSRLMDRPCRPLFPKGFNREVQVVATVLSASEADDPDVLALCGASAALSVSDIPFDGPIAGVRVNRIDGKLCINPSLEERQRADINFILAGSKDAIVMVEGGAKEAPEAEVLDALFYAHEQLQGIIEMQEELVQKAGKAKIEFKKAEMDPTFVADVKRFLEPRVAEAMVIKEKLARRDAVNVIKADLTAEFIKEDTENPAKVAMNLEELFEEVVYRTVRDMVFNTGKRIDGRDTKTVRPITIDVGVLPRSHGSALFTRGETQGLVVATLGVAQEAQVVDSLFGEEKNYFMLHYNFPPFSVGEVKTLRGPGRREIGHGALAERALRAVLPDQEKFPYVIRVVSEICESNGSSSMATVCGGTLSLMDAGVPIKAPVAGVAMGLMKEGDRSIILTDILGDEDHLGDMDFKVCGTRQGVTALQMDIKISGLDKEIMTNALAQAREGRFHILDKIEEAISAPRNNLSKHAPRIVTMKVKVDKIRDVIGPGGKMIKSISESHQVKIDIEDDGTVTISGSDAEQIQAAVNIIESLTAEAEVGKIYNGMVKRVADFGAFVEILPGVDGLVHISQLSDERVNRVEDILQEGDMVMVKVLEIDRQGKIRLSRKEALADLANGSEE